MDTKPTWIACRHHVFEIKLSDDLSATLRTSSEPDIALFKLFQAQMKFRTQEVAGLKTFCFCCPSSMLASGMRHQLHSEPRLKNFIFLLCSTSTRSVVSECRQLMHFIAICGFSQINLCKFPC